MDRDRLQQVQQSDVSENRVNQEFVDWLKTKGPNWLLVILVAICAYLFVLQWRQRQVDYVTNAWATLSEADTPQAMVDIADQYKDVGGLAPFAKLEAARIYIRAVQRGKTIQAVIRRDQAASLMDIPDDFQLTEEMREDYLTRADALLQQVQDDPKTAAARATSARVLYAVNALTARAAIAEARGDADTARRFYEQAADRAESFDKALASMARQRAETIHEAISPVRLISNPSDAVERDGPEVLQGQPLPREPGLQPVRIEPSLSDFLTPG